MFVMRCVLNVGVVVVLVLVAAALVVGLVVVVDAGFERIAGCCYCCCCRLNDLVGCLVGRCMLERLLMGTRDCGLIRGRELGLWLVRPFVRGGGGFRGAQGIVLYCMMVLMMMELGEVTFYPLA